MSLCWRSLVFVTCVSPDRRRLEWTSDPEACTWIRENRAAWLDREFEFARCLAAIDLKRAFVDEGASSTEHLGEEAGYDHQRVRELTQLGRGILEEPGLEQRVREKRIPFRAGIVVGRILGWPERMEPGDDWLSLAEEVGLRELQGRVRARIEEVAQRRKLHAVTAHLTEETLEKVDHCRMLAEKQRNGIPQTFGQTIDFMADETIRGRDPRWKPKGTRRLPPTQTLPWSRTVPADVTRELWERSGGLCEFGSCRRAGRDRCHLEPHAEGSGRETDDQVLGCRVHHKEFDAGLLKFLEWTGDGRPEFLVRATGELLDPKPRGDAGKAFEGARRIRRARPPPAEPPPSPPDRAGEGGASEGDGSSPARKAG